MILKFGILKKNKVVHFIDINNKNICSNRIIDELVDENLSEKKKYKLCKLCCSKMINKICINNNTFFKFQNILYSSENDIFLKKYFAIIDNGYLNIDNNKINYIKINKNYYYLINDTDLYDNNDFDINSINLSLKIGKLLGPKMAIIRKEMTIINNLKYNLWNLQ